MDKLSRFLALSGPEQRVLLQALLLLPLVWSGLRVVGLTRMQRWAAHISGPRANSGIAPQRIAALVDISGARLPLFSTCLTRSLLLVRLLGYAGVRTDLRIGVRRNGAELAAHAWVEHEGAPINDPQGQSQYYARLEPLWAQRSGTRA